MNDDLMAEPAVFEYAPDTKLQILQAVPGGNKDGEYRLFHMSAGHKCDGINYHPFDYLILQK
jgi:hypothetical protein